MALGDIYELVNQYNVLGQVCSNRYHYQNVGTAGDAGDLAFGWGTDVLPAVQAVQRVGFGGHIKTVVVNYNDLTDYAELDLGGADGARSNTFELLPSYVALSWTILRTSRAIRNGAKRVSGISEEAVVGNAVTILYQGYMDALKQALEAPVTGPLGGTFDLVLYGDVTPKRPTPIVVPVSSVLINTRPTTQNSRKAGVGT